MTVPNAALIVRDPTYGEEAVLELANGNTLRTNAGAVGDSLFGGDYVRVVSERGDEIAYWIHDEFVDDPVVVIGAVFGAAAGSCAPDGVATRTPSDR